MSAVRSMFSLWKDVHTSCAASEPAHDTKRSGSFSHGELLSHPLLNLMCIARERGLSRVHSVACMVFASILDNSSSWALSEAFAPVESGTGACSLLHLLPVDTALTIMAHISGLERLLQVKFIQLCAATPACTKCMPRPHCHTRSVQACPSYRNLLLTPEARVVFEKRMHPVAELFEVLMQPNDSSCCPTVSWQDAFDLFGALLRGNAAYDPLPHLLGSTLEKIALQAPQVRSST
jgi:hypothetical protein